MRIIPALVAALVALGTQAGVAAEHGARPPAQRRCVLLPPAQQPKPLRHATGAIVVTIPATTCNTPRR